MCVREQDITWVRNTDTYALWLCYGEGFLPWWEVKNNISLVVIDTNGKNFHKSFHKIIWFLYVSKAVFPRNMKFLNSELSPVVVLRSRIPGVRFRRRCLFKGTITSTAYTLFHCVIFITFDWSCFLSSKLEQLL